MNTKEEIIKALEGTCDGYAPPAVFTQTATVGQMGACGCTFPDANTDPVKMSTLALQMSKQFGLATARVPYCLTVEAERFGCEINMGRGGNPPMVVNSPYRSEEIMDVPEDLISVDEFVSGGRCATVLKAAEICSKKEDIFTIAGMCDPLAVVCHILGMENFLMGSFMEPERGDRWISAITPHISAYANALSEVSDCVTIITEGTSDIIPPDMFDMFVTEHIEGVIGGMRSYSVVHCCGDTSAVLDNLASLGETALSVETAYDPEGVIGRVGSKVRLIGGLNPVETLYQGRPAEIIGCAKRYSELGYAVIAPECGVPPQTPDGNLSAFAKYRES